MLIGAAGLAACSDGTTAPAACSGIALSPVAPLTIKAGAVVATNVYDTVTYDPSITLGADANLDPARMDVQTGKAAVSARLRVFNSQLPSTVIPVIFFVKGVAPGIDTLTIRTRFSGPSCPDGATLRIVATVTP